MLAHRGGLAYRSMALEVARRLRRAGDDVPVLALLDTYAPGYPPIRRDLGVAGRLRLLWRALRPLGHKDEPGWATLRRGLREQLLRLRARLSVGRPRAHAPPLPPTTRFIHLQEACFRATRGLRLVPYDGAVQLFRVDAPPPERLFVLDATLGWRPWVTGRLDVDVIPGRHSWHLREPNVQTLAAKLRTLLVSVPHADGWLARRLAAGGARVTAVDASDGMLRHARARGGAVEFQRLDVTSPAELRRLSDATYDLAVCNLALHDLADVRPLFDAFRRVVRRDGRVVLSLVHPERALRDGAPAGVPVRRMAVAHQPRPHVEVTRPLSELWRIAANAGLRVDTVLELPAGDDPAFALARLRFDD